MTPFKWLNRSLISGPYLTLCLNEKDFKAALRHCKITEHVAFTKNAQSDASTQFLLNAEGDQVAIVCVKDWQNFTGIEMAGLLVHEAIHVWQQWCENVGEAHPSSEFEAYAVQWISQQLMWEFERQTRSTRGRG